MKQIPLRPVLIGLVLLVAAVGLTRIVPSSPAGPSASATSGAVDGQCQKDRPGVTLIVDFGTDAGRDPIVKCALGFNVAGGTVSNELSGWQLFSAVGVDVVGTTEYPVGFVCRVAGYPLKADQPCTSTPSYAQGHWAYFYAQAGNGSPNHWTFSGTGAADHKPACGSAEGWRFVTGKQTNGTVAADFPALSPQVFSCEP